MYFFFDYIYYRITQWKFKSQGSTSPTALAFISVMQTMLIQIIISAISKQIWNKDELASHAKQLGLLAILIFLSCMFLNYKKFDGQYEKYLGYWKDEDKCKRFFKGILVIIVVAAPIVAFGLINTHWHK